MQQTAEGPLSTVVFGSAQDVYRLIIPLRVGCLQDKKNDEFELPQLTEEEKKKYRTFWGRFKSKSDVDLGSAEQLLASCYWLAGSLMLFMYWLWG